MVFDGKCRLFQREFGKQLLVTKGGNSVTATFEWLVGELIAVIAVSATIGSASPHIIRLAFTL